MRVGGAGARSEQRLDNLDMPEPARSGQRVQVAMLVDVGVDTVGEKFLYECEVAVDACKIQCRAVDVSVAAAVSALDHVDNVSVAEFYRRFQGICHIPVAIVTVFGVAHFKISAGINQHLDFFCTARFDRQI